MLKPLDIILPLQRVRLAKVTEITEAEKLIKMQISRPKYIPKLVIYSIGVAHRSYRAFLDDSTMLSSLHDILLSNEYDITKKSYQFLSRILPEISGDCFFFKRFEKVIEPLFDSSEVLEALATVAGMAASSTKDYCEKVEELVGIKFSRSSGFITQL
jgi:hypothetical protein